MRIYEIIIVQLSTGLFRKNKMVRGKLLTLTLNNLLHLTSKLKNYWAALLINVLERFTK